MYTALLWVSSVSVSTGGPGMSLQLASLVFTVKAALYVSPSMLLR